MPAWRCKDGRKLQIAEMKTDHLRNAAAMLRRNGRVTVRDFADAHRAFRLLGGEYAQDAAAREIANMHPSGILQRLEDELAKR